MTSPPVESLIDDRTDDGIFRVHRSALTSPEIFAWEKAAVFDKCWLYIGHESEVPEPGSFIRRTVNGRPMFMTRAADGEVRAFFNSCTHRGAMICREDAGKTKRLQCFYHAWNFDLEGNLVHVPQDQAYSGAWNKEDLALRRPARFDTYRGLCFVAFSDDVEPLSDYLGEAKTFLDTIFDQSDAGWRVVPGSNQYTIGANWKLMLENSVDIYHTAPLHKTYFNYAESFTYVPVKEGKPRGNRDLGNGHVVCEYPGKGSRPIARWSSMFPEEARPEIEAIRERLVERVGEEQAYRMADCSRLMVIFPNLIINDISALTVRVVEPIAEDKMEIRAWALSPKDESPGQLARRISSYTAFIGPGGLASPDDVEALESCQRGYQTIRELEWSDISRGAGQPATNGDELTVRAFWREWLRRLEENRAGPDRTDRSPNGRAEEATSAR